MPSCPCEDPVLPVWYPLLDREPELGLELELVLVLELELELELERALGLTAQQRRALARQ